MSACFSITPIILISPKQFDKSNISRVEIHKLCLFIGPESDQWECLSLTGSLPNWLTDSCLVNLIDVTLACEDANTKLVEVFFTDDNVDDEDLVGNSLMHIWELKLGNKANFLFRLWAQGFVQGFDVEVPARFSSWSLVNILPLMFCRGYEVESWSRCWSWV